MVDNLPIKTETDAEVEQREIRKQERQAAREREDRLLDLETVFTLHSQISSKADQALGRKTESKTCFWYIPGSKYG